jgi:hypothetical protein
LRQSVSITGLQSSIFEKIIHTVAEIHIAFSRAVGTENLEECQIITSYKEMSALELSNRYFTPHEDIAEGDELTLSADVDPYGYLANAAGTTLCHTEENAVLYFERQGSNDDNYKLSLVIDNSLYITHIFFNADIHRLNLQYLELVT